MSRGAAGRPWRAAAVLLGLSLAGGPAGASQAGYAVVTANPDATEAGVRVLAAGGSAADAAVAIQAVLGVVEPQSSGLGGGAILLYRAAGERRTTAFDGLAASPAAYEPGAAAAAGFAHSGAAVGVPGALRMLELVHRRHGRLPWAGLFGRAVELAEAGFTVSPYLARSLAAAARGGMPVPAWLADAAGKPLAEGATARDPGLAATLRAVAAGGADALYAGAAGPIAAAVGGTSQPGRLTAGDLAAYRAAEREPPCLRTGQGEVCSAPPPSYGGVAALELLGILAARGAAAPSFLDPGFVHAFAEAGRLAEADRLALVGDPGTGPARVDGLLDPAYLRARAGLIRDDAALPDPVPAGAPPGVRRPACAAAERAPAPSTSAFAVVDAAGDALAATTTVNVNFGAWVTVGGFVLNDALTNFARPADGGCPANAPAGGKRPATAMAPVIATGPDGAVILAGGSAGAGEIVDYVAQAALELLSGRPAAEALDDGHVSTAKAAYPESPGAVELEQGRAVAQLARPLQALGHEVEVVPLQSGLAFLVRRGGRWDGAADPRRDGTFGASP